MEKDTTSGATAAPAPYNIFTNRDGNTLIKEFEGVLRHNSNIKRLDAVVGFLRASGYFTLRPFLDNINKARVLIGIDVDKYIARAASLGTLFYGAEGEVKDDCRRLLRQDIESARYTKEVEDGILRMVDDLAAGRLELRAHPSKRIHAKIYVLYPEDFGEYNTSGIAITGSSNLSGNGLGVSEKEQYEFNVRLGDYRDVAFAKSEFERLWAEAGGCEITADDVKATVEDTYLRADVKPYDLYIKMLMEYFEGRVPDTGDTPLDMPAGYTRYDYQTDAVEEGYQKLIRYDGFFLADVVGLGKTVIATMIAKKFLLENGRDKTKILVVYPPAVEQNWKTTFKDFGIDKYANFVSNGSLGKVLDADNYNYWDADEFDLVLVDEAHKFRTNSTAAFGQLQEICKMPRLAPAGVPGYRKKVMLITATPMNNSPADIYNEIQLFQDPRRCTIDGVANLTAFFAPLIAEFKSLRRAPDYDSARLRRLSERVRDRVIKPLTVRRTRGDIESVPRYRKDVGRFPKVERPVESRYELSERVANFFEDAMTALGERLTYARYRAIAYLRPEAADGRYDNAETISRSLAGIRKNGLVKRLESSFYAFRKSLESFRQANLNMLAMFARDRVPIAPDLDINALIGAGATEEEIEAKLNAKAEGNPQNRIFAAADFRPEFLGMLRADQEILDSLCRDWATVTDDDDSKFARFDELLRHELFRRDRNPGQKLVVFSESADTVDYLARRMARKDALAVTAENRTRLFKTVRENFDANCRTRRDDFNIIITTDVLAEGVNLHRANVIVNYDTPWNSTRLMQRIGRVNRIGSASARIYNYVFYPSREGNRVINLTRVALSKIQTFHSTFGEDNQVYSQEEVLDRNLGKLFDEAVKARQEERNEELPFYEELLALHRDNPREYNRIARLSLRSRTGRAAREADGVRLAGDTLVFLKTNFRRVFFLVSSTAREISALDALRYFRAAPGEPGVPRSAAHHAHVGMALEAFGRIRDGERRELAATPAAASTQGGQAAAAASVIRSFLPEITDSDTHQKVEHLQALAERGVITAIPKRLQQIHKALQRGGGTGMTRGEALAGIVALAHKYAAYHTGREGQPDTQETPAEIILSESFALQ